MPRTLLILALYVLPFAAWAADGKAASPDPPWKSWLPSMHPTSEAAAKDVKRRFIELPDTEKADALRHIFETWDVSGKMDLLFREPDPFLPQHSFAPFVARWAENDFEAVFRRAEEWEGFVGHSVRIALVRDIAQRSPLEAARFMSDRLNPMSKQYYYYVTIYGLVPSLTRLPMSEIMPALAAMASGNVSMDEFRWGDSIDTLLHSEDFSWESPDLESDWTFLLTQSPGVLRDMLLGLVLERKLVEDLSTAIKIDLSPTRARLDYIKPSLWDGFPLDHQAFLKLLPEGDPFLMDCWVRRFIDRGRLPKYPDAAPKWSEWAAQVLAMKSGDKRDAALALFTRLRLQHDEFPARQWSATIEDATARGITEREVQVSEIIHHATEDWPDAYNAACALTSAPHRQRALMGVFEAGASIERDEVEACAKAGVPVPKEADRLLDAWTIGRARAAAEAERYDEAMALILTLRDADIRARNLEDYEYIGRFGGFAKVRQSIKDADIRAEEKLALLDAAVIDQVDGLMDGFHVPEEPGGFKAALEAATLIADPRLQFIHQRAVVHAASMDDLPEAKHVIETAKIDAAARERLMKEWDRLSKWFRPDAE